MAATAEKTELLNLGLAPRPDLGAGGRSVKQAKPKCIVCEAPGVKTDNWYRTCTHKPYYSIATRHERIPQTEQLENGRRRVTGYVEEEWEEERPNITQVSLSERVNNGMGVEWHQRYHGYIDPQELGLAEFCQYRDCWSQDVRFRTPHGNYCSEAQAKIIAADEQGKRLEVLDPGKRRQQLAEVNIR